LEVMKESGCNHLIFSSSATVSGAPDEVPIKETAAVGRCTNPYGWTKYMIEVILKDAAFADSDLSIALLRYFNPVGAHESGLIGEDPQGIPNNLMPYISQVAIGKLACLSVFGNDYPTKDGTGVRDYIHVVDLARGHACAIDYAASHKGVEVFNLGTSVGYSVLDMVNAFETANGVKVPYKFAPRREGDIAECFADATKSRELLGWKAEKTLVDMCRDSWNWQSKNPNGYDA
ncbi:MAG: UDP-glucose 4-epimerase GalE, partial [Clostridia bacterium]|nr:UDP-glucose 4-epimerase GalE [Clostridia bacterium]